jgi:hypothetical protein
MVSTTPEDCALSRASKAGMAQPTTLKMTHATGAGIIIESPECKTRNKKHSLIPENDLNRNTVNKSCKM